MLTLRGKERRKKRKRGAKRREKGEKKKKKICPEQSRRKGWWRRALPAGKNEREKERKRLDAAATATAAAAAAAADDDDDDDDDESKRGVNRGRGNYGYGGYENPRGWAFRGRHKQRTRRKESLPYNNKRRLLLAQHLNCLCVGGPPYWPSRGDATPALVGGCKGWPPPPRPFFSIPLHIPHFVASLISLSLPLSLFPFVFRCSRAFSILRRERLYMRLSVPLSGLWTSKLPPTLCTHPFIATPPPPPPPPPPPLLLLLLLLHHRSLEAATSPGWPFSLGVSAWPLSATTTTTPLRRATLEKVMPRRRRDAARGSYFIPGERNGAAVATTDTDATALAPRIRAADVASKVLASSQM